MQANPTEAADFRAAQRDSWNNAATGWDKWAPRLLEWTRHVSERLVDLAGVEAGSRVLDVATGLGEPALTAAYKAGPEGGVVATDIAPEMLAHARKRVAAAGVSNVEFIECEASKLEFAEGSFDGAFSRWGIIFEPEAEATAARIRGFLKPGARMAISSWGPPPEVPMIALPMRAVLDHLQLPPPPPGMPGPLSRPTPEAISAILQGGGFSGIEVEETQVVVRYASAEEFTTHTQDIVAPLVALLDPHPQDVRDAAWNAVTEAARQHVGDDGTVTMTNKVLLASGTA